MMSKFDITNPGRIDHQYEADPINDMDMALVNSYLWHEEYNRCMEIIKHYSPKELRMAIHYINSVRKKENPMTEQIDISKLKVGDRVHYQPEHYKDDEFENGLIKEIPEFALDKDHMYFNNIRVVYNCNGEWDRYKDYTSALTHVRDLKLGWR